MAESRSYANFVWGILIGVLGAICFSTKAIFVKLAYREAEVEAITLLALRMMFALPFFLFSATYSSRKSTNVKFTSKQWGAVAIVGCLGYYVSSLLDFVGLQYISAGIERLVLFVYPTLVLIISSMVFRSKISSIQWLAVLVTYGGLLLAFWGEATFQETDSDFFKGSWFIFACAITYALYIVGSGRLIPSLGAAKFNSYAMTFAAIAVLIHFTFSAKGSLFGQPQTIYVYSFLMAIVSTVIPSYLVSESIRRIGSGNTAIVASVGPVSTILQAYYFLQEPVHGLQIGGTLLIIVGVLMIGKTKQTDLT
ncbi:MAG TPA: DMT family transporter [Chryseolinea sp.]|nr:DMT family transporter [Chryseolinea sp.]